MDNAEYPPGLQRLADELQARGRPVPPPYPGGERPDPLAPPEGYSVTPVTGPEAPRGAQADTLCAHGRSSTTAKPVCGNERSQIWTLGDLAEHIVQLDLCDEHAMLLAQKIAAGTPVRCTSCGNTMRLEIRERLVDGAWHKVPKDTPVLLAELDSRLQEDLSALFEG